MKKTISTLFYIAYIFTASAQKTKFIRPVFGYGVTSLANKEDGKNAINSKLGSNPLTPQITYKPRIGLLFGLDFNKDKIGLSNISTGLSFIQEGQNYNGYLPYDTSNIMNRFENASAKILLNYISIPILAEFQLFKKRAFTPIASIGFNLNYLLSYNLDYESPYLNGSTYGYEVNNSSFKNITSNDPLNSYTATLNKWYYNRIGMMSNLGLGVNYTLNKKLNIQTLLTNTTSLVDIENKTDITYSYTDEVHKGQDVIKNPYTYYYSIVKNRNRWANGTNRGSTRIINFGIQFSLTYKLTTKNKN